MNRGTSQVRDHYEVLGVPKNATPDQIKKAYRKLAKEFHPDTSKGVKGAEEKFKEVARAYEVLSDAEKKATYDTGGGPDTNGGFAGFDGFAGFGRPKAPTGFGDDYGSNGRAGAFDDIFGGQVRRGEPKRGATLRVKLTIDFLEACNGCMKTLELKRQATCKTCFGSGAKPGSSRHVCRRCNGRGETVGSQGFLQANVPCQPCAGTGIAPSDLCTACHGLGKLLTRVLIDVTVPSGIVDGMTLKLGGEGEPGSHGAPPGDLLCEVTVKAHDVFKRNGNDILVESHAPFVVAALGGMIDVPTLNGSKSIKLDPGAQSSEVLRIKGAGVADSKTKVRGDLLIRVLIDVPKRLSPKQQTLLREFARESGVEDRLR